MRIWNAVEARTGFVDLVDAAVAEGPQMIRRHDGREVVLVSREAWEAARPTFLDVLLASAGEGGEDDLLDGALEAGRREVSGAIALRDLGRG